ncbi:carbohydrate ABC transporter permease [Lentzea sp. NPDC051208]|uniref:carbohydrate ABC transporter permease n=1 Tax=Lentzea sp. NPDC051208 TaxID=3154642 RepID=UPI003412EE93
MKSRTEIGEAIYNPPLSLPGKLVLSVFALFALLPVYWLTATAFMEREDVFSDDRPLVPLDPTLGNLISFFSSDALLRNLVNSVVVSAGTAGLSVLVGGLMAFSLSKFRYRGRNAIMIMLLIGQLIPGALLLVSLYLLLDSIGLLHTYAALILSFTTFTLPLTVFLLKGIMDNLPDEILEAAKIDGASRLATIWRIVFPLVVPGLLSAGMFAFMRGWSDLVFALAFGGPDRQTLPAGLTQSFIRDGTGDWPALMAASLITSLPLALIFIALQRYFVSGLAAGSVKG